MKTCKIDGCNNKHYGQGYCNKHYKRNWRYGDPLYTKIELHGMKNTSEYRSWCDMKRRCYNASNSAFHRYGGRDIAVCDKWKSSFNCFLLDMGLKPFPKAQIDRIDNNGNYGPDNCRWVTQTENARNRSGVKLSMKKVKEIRKLYKKGNITHKALGILYKVATPTIADVTSNRHWKT